MQQVTRELAQFVQRTRYDDLPERTLAAARRSLVNFLGVTIGGATHAAVESSVASTKALGSAGNAVLIGRTETADAASAALINGIGSAVLDFDSTQLKKTNIHPSGPVLPALFSTASTRALDGREFLLAFVLGVEVACRIANTVFGERNPGWHVTGAAGGVGAAIAVAKVLGLSVDQYIAAVGIAANQASGLREMYGTMCKALTPGRAAQSGLYAAFMAQSGFDGPSLPLEGGKGLAKVFCGLADSSGLVANLGEGYEIDHNIFKPYPCAIVTHATIDACAFLSRQHPDLARSLKRIDLDVPPIAIELAGIQEPQTPLESKFSLAHCAAVALSNGAVTVSDFSTAALQCSKLAVLRSMVVLHPNEGFRKEQSLVRVVRQDGSTLERHVPYALGSLGRPMSDDDVGDKFMLLVGLQLGNDKARDILQICANLASGGEVKQLIERCRPVVL